MPCDYSKYPPNWLTKIRPRILNRAENRCEQCKVENYAWIVRGFIDEVPVYQYEEGDVYNAITGEYITEMTLGWFEKAGKLIQVVLTIAHLDHDITHSEDSNLKALCQKCHNNYDRKNRNKNIRVRKMKNQLTLELWK